MAAKKPGKSELADAALLAGGNPVFGYTGKELEAALLDPDLLTRAEKIQQLLQSWGATPPQFVNDAAFKNFFLQHQREGAAQLILCWREALTEIQQRLATPAAITNKDLVAMLGQLGMQLKSYAEFVGPTASEAETDAEIAVLEKELGVSSYGSPTKAALQLPFPLK
jgi:hypothetical protein